LRTHRESNCQSEDKYPGVLISSNQMTN